MKIPTPKPDMDVSLWPTNKDAVLEVASLWYQPKLVSINYDAINQLPAGTIIPPQENNLTLKVSDDPQSLTNSIKYSIAMNSINYMFWRLDEAGEFKRYEDNGKVGAVLMTDLFNKAWNDPSSALNQALNGKALTDNDVTQLFGNIPDVANRTIILNEILTNSSLESLAQQMAQDAKQGITFDTTHAAKLAQLFPESYGDEVLKKAQLAVSAAWRNSLEHGLKLECDFTAFADYQVPNVLRALGILNYEDNLSQKIDSYQLITPNSEEEKALRGASILAVEMLAQQQGMNVADVDYWLWTKRKEPKTPFHLTETTAY